MRSQSIAQSRYLLPVFRFSLMVLSLLPSDEVNDQLHVLFVVHAAIACINTEGTHLPGLQYATLGSAAVLSSHCAILCLQTALF